MAAPGNPLGAVVVFDGETPRTFTALCRQATSGGEFVFGSGATGVVGSSADTYIASDINIALAVSDSVGGVTRVNGMALANAGSNSYTSVLQRGGAIVKCGGSVFGGTIVELVSGTTVDSVQSLTSGAVPGGLYVGVPGAKNAGRAITDGASGGFALVYLNL